MIMKGLWRKYASIFQHSLFCRSKRSWPEKRISKVFCQSVVWSRSVIFWLETSELLPGTPVVHCWLAWWESGAKSVDFAWLWLMGVCWTLWLDWDGWDDGLQVARWIHFIQIWLLTCLHSIYWKYNDFPCQTPCVMCCRRKRAGPDQPHESREEVAGWVSCYTTKGALRWWSFAETGTCQVSEVAPVYAFAEAGLQGDWGGHVGHGATRTLQRKEAEESTWVSLTQGTAYDFVYWLLLPEVGFPAASQTDFDFIRTDTQGDEGTNSYNLWLKAGESELFSEEIRWYKNTQHINMVSI